MSGWGTFVGGWGGGTVPTPSLECGRWAAPMVMATWVKSSAEGQLERAQNIHYGLTMANPGRRRAQKVIRVPVKDEPKVGAHAAPSQTLCTGSLMLASSRMPSTPRPPRPQGGPAPGAGRAEPGVSLVASEHRPQRRGRHLQSSHGRVASVLGSSQGPGREASEHVLKVRLLFETAQ